MKRITYFLMTVALISCNGTPEYTITGTVSDTNLNGQYVYLKSYGFMNVENQITYDSTLVENSTFTFHGIQEIPELRMVNFSPNVSYLHTIFISEKGNINITIDNPSAIGGTPDNDIIQKHNLERGEISNKIRESWENIRNASTDEEKQLATLKKNELLNDFYACITDFASENANNLKGGYSLIRDYIEFPEKDKIAIFEKSNSVLKSIPGMDKMEKQIEALKKVTVGSQFADFELPDRQGNFQKLSDYAGKDKIILIDFWASWCGPCIEEIPNLKATYNTYKDKGFEIVGVSLDSDKENWIKAMDKYELNWPNLSDLKVWENKAAALYCVMFIPQTVLIDKDGTIIDKNLRGSTLDDRLKEIFN